MYHYLFTNDLRISKLDVSLQEAAKLILDDAVPSADAEKSKNNNINTLGFYFNLNNKGLCAKLAREGKIRPVVLNFIKKFQFPNFRKEESYKETVQDGIVIAPLRVILKTLFLMNLLYESKNCYLTLGEIKNFIFFNNNIAKTQKSGNILNLYDLIGQIFLFRQNNKFPQNIETNPNNIVWNQMDRQIREMIKVLIWSGCVSENKSNSSIFIKNDVLSDNEKATIYDIINYNEYWQGSSKENYQEYMEISDSCFNSPSRISLHPSIDLQYQQIFYGAPGTGKSHALKDCTKGCEVIRTTFHPDSDYSTFVGSYKPTSEVDSAGNEKIVYRFVVQSFLQAYISAWKKYELANNSTQPEKVFLVIEEINRGNCAQIFGDLFQLLDRNDSGFSDYQIKADSDMKKQLNRAFSGLSIPLAEHINSQYGDDNTTDKIISGDILLLPNNLYIWATMNTSDQSLFPIDSAFKRRWNWTYMPISNANKDWVIKIDNSSYDWWSFIEKINDKIGATTNSEDKKLGYFFCKAKDKVISQKTFVGKVIFYLWNDVFKDYDFDDDIFNDVDGSKLTFEKFYTSEGMNSQIVSEKVIRFLENLHVQKLSTEENSSDDNNDESNKENDIEEHQE